MYNKSYVYMIYFKELSYETVGSGWAKFEICRAGLPAGNS